jgi:tripartite-type tricarboxylate transporter receptor subunit TctC
MIRHHVNGAVATEARFPVASFVGLLSLLMPVVCCSQQSESAAQYPQRPIRMIVPYPPGGSTDILTRIVSLKLAGNLNQQVVVDNRPGGGGNIAAEVTARANPDGYTLLMTISSLITTPAVNPKTNYDPVRDFAPILLIARSPYRIVVNPMVPANTIQEWFALVKSKPGYLNYGTAGTGSAVHLAVELFKIMSGVNIVHVPYKGTGPAMTDLIGGQIQMMFGGTLSSLPHVKAGRIRALAVTSLQRRADSPELPTVAETILPGYEAGEWFGVIGPAGLPRPLLARIHAELTRVVKDPEMKERLSADGLDLAAGSPDEFSALIKRDLAKWMRVVKETKMTPE